MDNRRRSNYRRSRIPHEKEKTAVQKILVYTYRQSILTMILFALFLGIRLIPIQSTQNVSNLLENSISQNVSWETAVQITYNTFTNIPYMEKWFSQSDKKNSKDQIDNSSGTMAEDTIADPKKEVNMETSEPVESVLPLEEFQSTEQSNFLDQTSVGK